MHSHVALRSLSRIAIALFVCAALLPVSELSLFVTGNAQTPGQGETHAARPKRGRPEGTWTNLDDLKNESQIERESPGPIHSTMRSAKIPLQPWNGRRVGDPLPDGKVVQPIEPGQTRRAHARRRFRNPPTVFDDQFVQNFFTWTVLHAPSANELTYWNDQFRVAYAQGLTLPTVDPNKDGFGKWSDFYHFIVSQYCKRQERF